MGCKFSKDRTYNKYEMPNSQQEGSLSGPFINPKVESFSEIEKYYQDKCMIDLAVNTMSKWKVKKSMGYRKRISETELEKKFTFYTYGQILDWSTNLSHNLKIQNLTCSEKVNGEDFELIGIFSKNCCEWIMTDYACQMNSIATVTLYATLGDEAFAHICTETNLTTICISVENIQQLMSYKEKYQLMNLKNVIVYDRSSRMDNSMFEMLNSTGLNIFSFTDLIKPIQGEIPTLRKPIPDTIVTICYTSGTTGMPKGAMITQRNMAAQMVNVFDANIFVDENTVHISYLPLAHIMERIVIHVILCFGGTVGFISGDVRTYLTEDMEILKPNIFFSVPRVLGNFRQKILETFEKMPEGFKKNLVFQALKVKRENLKSRGVISHSFYDRVVFNKVREILGGRVNIVVSCSAPLSKELSDDIKILLSAPVGEGYGMTECTAACLETNVEDFHIDTVGGIITISRLKLVDVPEMGYTSKSTFNGEPAPSGEVCLNGPCVFKGFYKKPKETSEALDAEGWLHTGDVGILVPHNKSIKIIDRVKEIFKLSQGEYIAPTKLESSYSKSKYVTHLVVYGKSTRSTIIGIIVPNKISLVRYLESTGRWNENMTIEDYYEDEDIKKEIRQDLEIIARENNFNGLERINHFILTRNDFTVENGCMTPTMKFVRKKIEAMLKEEIENLYAKISK